MPCCAKKVAKEKEKEDKEEKEKEEKEKNTTTLAIYHGPLLATTSDYLWSNILL